MCVPVYVYFASRARWRERAFSPPPGHVNGRFPSRPDEFFDVAQWLFLIFLGGAFKKGGAQPLLGQRLSSWPVLYIKQSQVETPRGKV